MSTFTRSALSHLRARSVAVVPLIALVATFANQFQANPAVPPELIAELGLTVRGGGGSSPLFAPANLVADGCSNGINMLKWSANGNISGTQYIVEAAYDGTTDWDFVDVTTKSKFDHEGQTPGRPVVYRVYAKRAGQKSGFSNEATVYSGGGLQVLEGGQQAA